MSTLLKVSRLAFLLSVASSGVNAQTPVWQKSAGFPGTVTRVSAVLPRPQGDVIAATRGFGFAVSSDNGVSFNSIPSTITTVERLAVTSNGTLFEAPPYGLGILTRSTDGGTTWTYDSPEIHNNLRATSVCAFGDTVVEAGNSAYYEAKIGRSTSAAGVWMTLYSYNQSSFMGKPIVMPVLATNGQGTLLTSVEIAYSTFRVLRSTDWGRSWGTVDLGLSPKPRIRGFAWNSTGMVLAATSAGVLRSTDNGTSWAPANGLLPTLDVTCVGINARDQIYIGTSMAGVFASSDNGATWSGWSEGLTDSVINTIAFTPDGYCLVGTEYGGVFRTIQSTVSVRDELQNERGLPGLFLLPNYPNPFNSMTTIGYSLAARGHVQMSIVDLLGREVGVLIDRVEDAGVRSIRWDAAGVSSGVYLCRLSAEGGVASRKMIIMK